MQNNLKISVIIPVYNSDKYIGRCIRSLLKQTLKKTNYELVIIDDNSKDQSLFEIKSRRNARRSVFYKKSLKKKVIIQNSDLIMLRPGTGLSPSKINSIVGKKLKKDKSEGEFVKSGDFK